MENLVKRDNVWTQKAKELYKIRQLRLQYEKLEKNLLNNFKVLNNGVDSIGGGYKFTITTRTGSINYKDIPELKNIDLTLYRNDDIEVCSIEYVGE